jgi:hypothetical protein
VSRPARAFATSVAISKDNEIQQDGAFSFTASPAEYAPLINKPIMQIPLVVSQPDIERTTRSLPNHLGV